MTPHRIKKHLVLCTSILNIELVVYFVSRSSLEFKNTSLKVRTRDRISPLRTMPPDSFLMQKNTFQANMNSAKNSHHDLSGIGH